MKDMTSSKQLLRSQLRLMRDSLRPNEVDTLSDKIIAQTVQLIDWQDVQTMHIYTPLRTAHEVDTTKLISWVQKHQPLVRIATWTSGKNPESIWLDDGRAAGEQQFDVVVVPSLGFNDEQHRLGFGGGFYDRFLKSQTKLRIGLCYEFGHVNFASEAHDIVLDYIVTNQETYKSHL